MQAEVAGLTPGLHGFHIHQWGNLTNGCMTAGPHFNPTGATHGGPQDAVRHAGHLGNLVADEKGNAVHDAEDSMLTLTGPWSIIGRSVVVHA